MEICTDIHKALEAVTRPYEQVCFIIDDGSMNDGLMNDVLMNDGLMRLGVSEAEKGIETVEKIWDFLFSQGMTRRGLLVAIGGGVLTDIAGFAAATCMRGIDYVNVPTTLLAMVDASSGGKTGINYHGLKNSIGAFHAPKATLIYPEWLRTLPASQFLSGFGEMLKMGLVTSPRPSSRGEEGIGDRSLVIGDSGLWEALLRYDLETMPIEELTPLIASCVAAKERIVAADPQEKGWRKVLNFGHTLGHAIEKCSNFSYSHGQCVAFGCLAAMQISGTMTAAEVDSIERLMAAVGLETRFRAMDQEEILQATRKDKKMDHGHVRFILLRQLGEAYIDLDVSDAQMLEGLRSIMQTD